MATNATATIAGNLLSGNWSAANVLGTDALGGSISLPAFKAIEFLNGTGVGQINRIGFASGTLTNATPGTTDTALVNLASLTDLNGATFTDMTKLVGALFFNDATTAGYNLVLGNSGTNDFADLFNGTATGVLKLPPGHVSPTTNANLPAGILVWTGSLAGWTIDATHKIIKHFSGSAASLPYRSIFIGRA